MASRGSSLIPGVCRFTILVSLLLLSSGLTSRPALAQVDLSGKWAETLTEDEPDLFPGPEIGDYTEMPINDAARMRADTWDAQKLEMIEHECDPHGATYAPFGLMFRQDLVPFTEAVAAWEVQLDYMHEKRTIYMDGRPHPPASAPHTWEGFSTGEWEGDMLRVNRHPYEGSVFFGGTAFRGAKRPHSYNIFIPHGDFMTVITDVEDPVYLTEPFIRNANFVRAPTGRLVAHYCLPQRPPWSIRRVMSRTTCPAKITF
jgi:hypothetical protein